jgi:large subunit ribosomal protein L25
MSNLDFSKAFEGVSRAVFGTSAAKKIKKTGFTPCSIYNNGEVIHFAIDSRLANKLVDFVSIKTKVLSFDIGGKTHKSLIKQIAFNPVTSKVDCIEFVSCDNKKEVQVLIPLNIKGKSISPGIKRNGKVNIIKYEIPTLCNLDSIPEEIVVDISTFGLGKTFTSKSLTLPEGCKTLSDFPILSIIGRGKKDSEEEQAAAASTPEKK